MQCRDRSTNKLYRIKHPQVGFGKLSFVTSRGTTLDTLLDAAKVLGSEKKSKSSKSFRKPCATQSGRSKTKRMKFSDQEVWNFFSSSSSCFALSAGGPQARERVCPSFRFISLTFRNAELRLQTKRFEGAHSSMVSN